VCKITDSEKKLIKSIEKSIDPANWGGMHHLTIDELNQLLKKQPKVNGRKYMLLTKSKQRP
jgi:hypothetical protein